MKRRIVPEAILATRWSGRDLVRAFAAILALGMIAAWFLSRDAETSAGGGRAVDGDSLFVGGVEIRLAGIAAPELRQSCEAGGKAYRCGEEARRALAEILAGGPVTCRAQGRDRYGRRIARCSAGGEDLGAALVAEGWAIPMDGEYSGEEARARRARLGLWAGTFEPPASFRRANPR